MLEDARWADRELLGFDLETTGVDRFDDVCVSFALVRVERGAVQRVDTALVDPGRDIPAGATAIHGISTERARAEGMALDEAVELLAEALIGAARRGVPVVGIKLDYDLTMLDVQCRRVDGRGLVERGWAGNVLDALVIDRRFDRYRKGHRTLGHLCGHYGVDIRAAHDAAADAEAAIGVLLAMSATFPELRSTDVAELHLSQVEWHREWAAHLDVWRQGQGEDPLDPRDYFWPLCEAALV